MALKLKGLEPQEKMFKKSFQLKESVNQSLADYVDYLEDVHKVKTQQQSLIPSIIETHIDSDKEFKKWREKKAESKKESSEVKEKKPETDERPHGMTANSGFNLG